MSTNSLILVTGASTGLGLLTAGALADAGHAVVLHTRSPERSPEPAVLERMHAAIHGDLADPDQTRDVARQAERFGHFHAVIHNAGVMHTDVDFAVNTVAPFVLTALMPAPARSIFLSSDMHHSGTPDPTLGDAASYSDSKLFVTALAMALATRRPADMSHAVTPGWVPTRMGGPGATGDLTLGHRTQEWLATAPDTEIVPRTGGYWYHRQPQAPHPAATDPSFQDELVAVLEQHTGLSIDG